MRVAFFTYPSAFQSIGGGEILMLQLSKALREKGLEVKFFDIWNDKLSSFDILHIFSCQGECLGIVDVAVALGVPVVVHPITFETWSSIWYGVDEKSRWLSLARFLLKKACPFFPSLRRTILKKATLLFPNSSQEASYLQRHFGIPKHKMFVAPNGVEPSIEQATPEDFIHETGIKDSFVLCSGRIEPRKNQKNFILAVNQIDVPAVILGDVVKGYESYYAKCRRLAGPNVKFLPRFPSESKTLYSAYAASRVVVLPAYVETPGLVGLEAGLIGRASLCVTQGGPTREYYGTNAAYLNPASVRSIVHSIQTALSAKPDNDLKERIKKLYTWEKVADKVIEGYKLALSYRSGRVYP